MTITAPRKQFTLKRERRIKRKKKISTCCLIVFLFVHLASCITWGAIFTWEPLVNVLHVNCTSRLGVQLTSDKIIPPVTITNKVLEAETERQHMFTTSIICCGSVFCLFSRSNKEIRCIWSESNFTPEKWPSNQQLWLSPLSIDSAYSIVMEEHLMFKWVEVIHWQKSSTYSTHTTASNRGHV